MSEPVRARSTRGRKPLRPEKRIASPIVRELIDRAAGKEVNTSQAASLTSNYISQLRYGDIADPGLSAVERLAAALDMRVVLVPASSVSSTDAGRTTDVRAE